jgi:hypothetical protein
MGIVQRTIHLLERITAKGEYSYEKEAFQQGNSDFADLGHAGKHDSNKRICCLGSK